MGFAACRQRCFSSPTLQLSPRVVGGCVDESRATAWACVVQVVVAAAAPVDRDRETGRRRERLKSSPTTLSPKCTVSSLRALLRLTHSLRYDARAGAVLSPQQVLLVVYSIISTRDVRLRGPRRGRLAALTRAQACVLHHESHVRPRTRLIFILGAASLFKTY